LGLRFARLLITRKSGEAGFVAGPHGRGRPRHTFSGHTFTGKDEMGGFNLQELMSQAKRQYEVLQKKLEETVVEGSSGGGSVVVKMDGRKQVLSMKIDPEAVKSGDVEMLQDLVTAAINGASRKVDEAMQSSMGGMLGGLVLPGL
jgi:DNA-binding YbaB/EbfC family protein